MHKIMTFDKHQVREQFGDLYLPAWSRSWFESFWIFRDMTSRKSRVGIVDWCPLFTAYGRWSFGVDNREWCVESHVSDPIEMLDIVEPRTGKRKTSNTWCWFMMLHWKTSDQEWFSHSIVLRACIQYFSKSCGSASFFDGNFTDRVRFDTYLEDVSSLFTLTETFRISWRRRPLCPRMRWDFIVIQTSAHWREDPLNNTMLRLCVHLRMSINETRVRITDIDLKCLCFLTVLENETWTSSRNAYGRNNSFALPWSKCGDFVYLSDSLCLLVRNNRGIYFSKDVSLWCACLTKHASKLRLKFSVWVDSSREKVDRIDRKDMLSFPIRSTQEILIGVIPSVCDLRKQLNETQWGSTIQSASGQTVFSPLDRIDVSQGLDARWLMEKWGTTWRIYASSWRSWKCRYVTERRRT